MSHLPHRIFSLIQIMVFDFFRRTVPPLIWTGWIFRIKIFNCIFQCIKTNSLICLYQQTTSALIWQDNPTRICTMSVFLRTNIIHIHWVGNSLIAPYHASGITVYIVFFRTTTEILYHIHILRYMKTYPDTRYFKIVFLFFLFTGSISRKMSILRHISLHSLLVSSSKLHGHIHHSIRIYFIIDTILISGR